MGRKYWYVIRIDGKEVWRGKNPQDRYWDFKKENPNKRVSIAWESDDDLLVGRILKPIIYFEIFSEKHSLWCGIDDVLVDTGADITLIPRNIGEGLVNDIFTGTKAAIKGITPFELDVYIHDLKIRMANKEFETKVAIADSEEVPAVLGRFEALDLFAAEFVKGKEFALLQ